MKKQQQERALILMKATLDILNKCNDAPYVLEVMEVTAIWDEAECDGNCLRDELESFMEDII